MERSRSPLSENTIRRTLEDDFLDDNFISDVSDTNSLSSDSETQSATSSYPIDDTDSDPDYNPHETSNNRNRIDRILQSFGNHEPTTSDEEEAEADDPRPRLPPSTTNQPRRRPRGRPRNTNNL